MCTSLFRPIFCLLMVVYPTLSSTLFSWSDIYDKGDDGIHIKNIMTCPEVLQRTDMIALQQIPIPFRKYLKANSSNTEDQHSTFPEKKLNGRFFGGGGVPIRTEGHRTHANQQQEIQCEYMVAWIRAYFENPCRCPSAERIAEESISEWLRVYITSQTGQFGERKLSPCDLQQWIVVFVESRQRDFHFRDLSLSLTDGTVTNQGSHVTSGGMTQRRGGTYQHRHHNLNGGRGLGSYTIPRSQYPSGADMNHMQQKRTYTIPTDSGAGMNRNKQKWIGSSYTLPTDSMAKKGNEIQRGPLTLPGRNVLPGSHSPPRKIIRKFYISNPPPPFKETVTTTTNTEYGKPPAIPEDPEPVYPIIEEESIVENTLIPQKEPGSSIEKVTLNVLESNVSNSDMPEEREIEETIITKTTIVETYFEIPDSYKNINATENWILESEEISQPLEGNGGGAKLVTEGDDGSENSGGQMRIIEKVIEELPYSSEKYVIGNGEHMAIEQEHGESPVLIDEQLKGDGNEMITEKEVSKVLTEYKEEPEADGVVKKITTIIEDIPEGYVKGEDGNREGQYPKGDGGNWIFEEVSGISPDSAKKYTHNPGENTIVEEIVESLPAENQKGGRWVIEEYGGQVSNVSKAGGDMGKWIFEEVGGGIPNSGDIFTQGNERKWIIEEGVEKTPKSEVRYATGNSGNWVTYEDGGRPLISDEGYAQGGLADGNGGTEISGEERPHGEGLVLENGNRGEGFNQPHREGLALENGNQDFIASGDRYVAGDDGKPTPSENGGKIEFSGNESSGMWVYDSEPNSIKNQYTLNKIIQTVDTSDGNKSASTLQSDIPDSAIDIVSESTADDKKKKKNRKVKWVFVKKDDVPSKSTNDNEGGINKTIEVTPDVVTEIVGDSTFKDGL